MRTQWIAAEKSDGILTLWLDRPDKLNAMTSEMRDDLADAFDAANGDDDVRVIIVAAKGRAFCAGADISDGPEAFGEGAARTFGTAASPRDDSRFVDSIHRCLKPSIAAINGPAIGLGITLALPMDIRIASADARFGFVFSRRGLVPEAGAAWFLPRIVGMAQAMRWCYSGAVFDAAEALQHGLVSEVVAPADLIGRAREIAREIVEQTAPVSIALMRQMFLQFSNDPDPGRLLETDSVINRQLGASADVREGVAAFLEKRRPLFPNRVSDAMPAAWPWAERQE